MINNDLEIKKILAEDACSDKIDVSQFADCYKTVTFSCPHDYIIVNGVRYGYQGGEE